MATLLFQNRRLHALNFEFLPSLTHAMTLVPSFLSVIGPIRRLIGLTGCPPLRTFYEPDDYAPHESLFLVDLFPSETFAGAVFHLQSSTPS